VELVVVLEVVTVVDEVVEVVSPPHGQSSSTDCPTAFFRQVRASLAVGLPPLPLGSQMQTGLQVSEPTAARRMNRQSDAVGFVPLVTG
jgi:hypothetical protein